MATEYSIELNKSKHYILSKNLHTYGKISCEDQSRENPWCLPGLYLKLWLTHMQVQAEAGLFEVSKGNELEIH